MHFTNGETEARSGKAVYLGYSSVTVFLWVGCAQEPQGGAVQVSVPWPGLSFFPVAYGSVITPVPKSTAIPCPMPDS